ncbi:MAG: hypothetical protein E7261_07545 [Lachnospiraceae bacterium]|nr:hypothetical protein [Lachnospiraceae bacterium]
MLKIQNKNTKNFSEEVQLFFSYIKNNSIAIIIFNVIFLFVYYSWLGKVGLRIDSEFMINHPNTYYNYLVLGRPGLAFTQWLFGYKWFNPSHYVLFAYLLLCVAGTLFGYLCYRSRKRNSVGCAAFGLLMFTCPLFVEQFYFSNQIFGIAWAYVLCAIAVGFSYYAMLRKSVVATIPAIIGMVWSFSTYQIYIVIYVAMVFACFLMLYSRWELDGENTEINLWRLALGILLQLIVAFAIYWFIVNKWFMAGGYYLKNQIAWKNETFEQGISNILAHGKAAVLGQGTFYTVFFAILSLLSILCVVTEIIRFKKAHYKWMYMLAVIVLQISPFIMTVYLGTVPVERAQLVYPLVLAADSIFLLSKAEPNKLSKIVMAFVIFLMFWTQSSVTMRLLYTDEIREQEDIRLAEQIELRLQEIEGYEQKEVAFVGVHNCNLNLACIKGSLIGASVFNWDSAAGPKYLNSTARIWGILHTLGYSYQYVWTEEQMVKARTQAMDMPCWPEEGSVVDKGEFIIVKLSEDLWQSELTK